MTPKDLTQEKINTKNYLKITKQNSELELEEEYDQNVLMKFSKN